MAAIVLLAYCLSGIVTAKAIACDVLITFGLRHGRKSELSIMVTRIMNHFVSAAAFVLILFHLAGCASTARPLMPTPDLYHEPPVKALFTDVPQERRRPEVELLYITDRMAEKNPDTELPYGEKRARSLAFGTAVVDMVPALNWSELERQSQLAERSAKVDLEMGRIDELGRFPEEPYALEVTPTGVRRARNVVAAHERSKADFRVELRRHLAQSRNGEVMLYVHGFNETFATAASTRM